MASTETARKPNIISHMNADHVSSLSLYLQHHAKVPPSNSSSAKLTNISRTNLTILDNSGIEHQIPIEPPLQDWSEIRSRLKTMHDEACLALGLPSPASDTSTVVPAHSSHAGKDEDKILINRWTAPHTPGHFLGIAIVVSIFIVQVLLRLGYLSRGSFIYETILVYCPGGADRFVEWNKGIIPVFTVASHVVEVVIFDLFVLGAGEGKYGIFRGQKLWWQWVWSTFLEGLGSTMRFKALVEERRRVMEKRAKRL